MDVRVCFLVVAKKKASIEGEEVIAQHLQLFCRLIGHKYLFDLQIFIIQPEKVNSYNKKSKGHINKIR